MALDTDVLYLNLIGSSVVVLNGMKAAQDLFEKRSNLYSGRYAPHIVQYLQFV